MAEKSFYKRTTFPDLISKEKSLPMPEKIGPYLVEGLLNKGGMSLLYLGVHPDTKENLAIKVLSPSFVTHPEAVERFLKEARIIALTSHPNIVKLYGQGEWEEGLYIAMEFVRGISLSQFIIQQSFSLKRSIEIILQVAYALLHLHTHGVIHRDLKPENILITQDGEIKVIDFGIAQLHEEVKLASATAKFLGTPSYMSPEQKEDSSKATFASDIYSLGVIAYELVTGKLSYGVINPTLLPKGLQKIIGKALASSLNERYQDIVDFISDLSQYLKSGELEKDRPGVDQIKEFAEALQKTSSALSPSTPPNWPEVEIGVGKHKGAGQMGIYYDFFKLPNNNFVVVLGESPHIGVEAPVYISALRSMVRTLMHEKGPPAPKRGPREPFRVLPFITSLNQLVQEDNLKQLYPFGFLLLDPLREQLTYVSCGLGRLIHLELGNVPPRLLALQNVPLGSQPTGDFAETIDNWKVGDTLILHSFETAFPQEEAAKREMETQLLQSASESNILSPRAQADAMLRKAAALPGSSLIPKILLSLRRVT